MHAISSYHGNRPTNTHTNTPTHPHTNRQDRLQYTAPHAQCKQNYSVSARMSLRWRRQCHIKNITIFQQTATDYTSNVSYDIGQWLFYTPIVWGGLLTLGRYQGSRGCAPVGPGAEPLVRGSGGGAKPQKLKAFVSLFFWGTRRDQTLWPILTHDGSTCAESRKDVPFLGLKF